MKVVSGTLLFDDLDSRCTVVTATSAGKEFAFVQALDNGHELLAYWEPKVVRFWGPYDRNDKHASIEKILQQKDPWPKISTLE
ncbi:hypothetical protein [Shewanella algae]|uniref:hypothetical protein n=1 Tax=Shewanella algae TaxID=38313 RepID=UPI001AAE9E45|nr:hypothetical protein [Shewanella algae]MBO2580280.1 hypothetical protein [Shewanella algae]